jgi:hypothetical protein
MYLQITSPERVTLVMSYQPGDYELGTGKKQIQMNNLFLIPNPSVQNFAVAHSERSFKLAERIFRFMVKRR